MNPVTDCPICGEAGDAYVTRKDYWRYKCRKHHSWAVVTDEDGHQRVGP